MIKKKKKDFHRLKIEAKYGFVLEVTADASHNYDIENKLSLRKSFVLIFLDSKLTKILRPIH